MHQSIEMKAGSRVGELMTNKYPLELKHSPFRRKTKAYFSFLNPYTCIDEYAFIYP